MPIYEYQCQECKWEFSVLVLRMEEEGNLTCTNCGGKRLKKLISRVTFHVSESDRLAQYDPRASKSDTFYKDSRNIGLHAKKRAQEMGVDLGPSFENKLEKLRTDPGSVLKDSE
ncbi:MAG: zinc ribbon domain-containing protein [Deltaproteobacteria bacterium]|nr:zinc ribbon domain-containing protein [Deltaproteobacteria bacterium]